MASTASLFDTSKIEQSYFYPFTYTIQTNNPNLTANCQL